MIDPERFELRKHDVIAFIRKMASVHPELAKPASYPEFQRIAEREGVAVRVVKLSRPARLIRLRESACIQLNIALGRAERAVYGFHELCHFWRDDPGEPCYYAEENSLVTPEEEYADMFAWIVTSPARVFLPGLRDGLPDGVMFGSQLAKKQKRPKLSPAVIVSEGAFTIHVVGTSFRQHELVQICGGRAELGWNKLVDAVLTPVDDNPHDPKAVRVDIHDRHVGFLSRHNARAYREKFGMRPVRCAAHIVGGWNAIDGGSFGVRLDLRV